MDFEKIMQLLEATWFVPVVTFWGALIGGIFTFLGSIVAVNVQTRIKNRNNKRAILLEYYMRLAKFMMEVEDCSVMIISTFENYYYSFEKDFRNNGYFSYYIANVFLKKEHAQFVIEVETILKDRSSNMEDIKKKLIQCINQEMKHAINCCK